MYGSTKTKKKNFGGEIFLILIKSEKEGRSAKKHAFFFNLYIGQNQGFGAKTASFFKLQQNKKI